jgi:hypothetical protein
MSKFLESAELASRRSGLIFSLSSCYGAPPAHTIFCGYGSFSVIIGGDDMQVAFSFFTNYLVLGTACPQVQRD